MIPHRTQRQGVVFVLLVLLVAVVSLIVAMLTLSLIGYAVARDPEFAQAPTAKQWNDTVLLFVRDTTGLSAQLTPEQNEWIKGLRNSAGSPCCDDADGIDPVWRVGRRGFEVEHKGGWLEVPLENVLHQINRIGVARAWIGFDGQKYFVRCFLAGAQI